MFSASMTHLYIYIYIYAQISSSFIIFSPEFVTLCHVFAKLRVRSLSRIINRLSHTSDLSQPDVTWYTYREESLLVEHRLKSPLTSDTHIPWKWLFQHHHHYHQCELTAQILKSLSLYMSLSAVVHIKSFRRHQCPRRAKGCTFWLIG